MKALNVSLKAFQCHVKRCEHPTTGHIQSLRSGVAWQQQSVEKRILTAFLRL